MRRLEAARAQKDVSDSSRVVKQQELHKSLRVSRILWRHTSDNRQTREFHCMIEFFFKLFSRISTTSAVRSVTTDQSASAISALTPKCWPRHPGICCFSPIPYFLTMFLFIFNKKKRNKNKTKIQITFIDLLVKVPAKLTACKHNTK